MTHDGLLLAWWIGTGRRTLRQPGPLTTAQREELITMLEDLEGLALIAARMASEAKT